MCNEELIARAQIANGIEEECHTYAAWKKLGYQVQCGNKALFKTTIWKYTSKRNDKGEKEEHMFMQTAAFFGRSQVEKIA